MQLFYSYSPMFIIFFIYAMFTLQGLSSLGNNVRLKEVSLSECVNITDLGLQKFAQQCVEIERLDLSHCQVHLYVYSCILVCV